MKPERVKRLDALLKSRQWWTETDRKLVAQVRRLPLDIREDLAKRPDQLPDGAITKCLTEIHGRKNLFIVRFLVTKEGQNYAEEYVAVRSGQQYMAKGLILISDNYDQKARSCLVRRTVPFVAGERIYDLIGGIRRPGESLPDTLIREIKQQTGIFCAKLNLLTYSLLESELSDVKMLLYAATVTPDQVDLDRTNNRIRAIGTELAILTPEDFQDIKSANMSLFAAYGLARARGLF